MKPETLEILALVGSACASTDDRVPCLLTTAFFVTSFAYITHQEPRDEQSAT